MIAVIPPDSGLLSPPEFDRYHRYYADAIGGESKFALFNTAENRSFTADSAAALREKAMVWAAKGKPVYGHIHLHRLPPGEQNSRGRKETVSSAIGLFSDIDAEGPKRKKSRGRLCPTVADAFRVAEDFGVTIAPPSLIINSGYGCYAVTLFKEPFEIQGDADRQRLEAIGRRYHEALHRIAERLGWTGAVDYCDPSKVIRVPGTVNLKDPTKPIPVRIAVENSARYNIGDLEDLLPEVNPPKWFAVPSAPDESAGNKVPNPTSAASVNVPFRIERPPKKQIDALLENSSLFIRTWNYERSEFSDDSCSAYDMALANIGVRCGMTDSLIAGLIDLNRERYPRGKRKRKRTDYLKYLALTIAKVRAQNPDVEPVDSAALEVSPVVIDKVIDNQDTEAEGSAGDASAEEENTVADGPMTRVEETKAAVTCEPAQQPARSVSTPHGHQDSPAEQIPPAEQTQPAAQTPPAVPDANEAPTFKRTASYPAPLGPAAYHGVIGEFVKAVEPHTEADPNAILVQALAYAGNTIGRHAFIWVGGQKHHTNLFVNVVGTTSTGRKGSANGPLDLFFGQVDPAWARNMQSGLSSGEGLIWCVRDPIYTRIYDKKTRESEEVQTDPGVADKRALVKQSEFFGALQVMRRSGNTLSPVMREAWDTGNLRSMTKNSPANATNAHITLIGNITKEELLRGMLGGEMDNGFANRFLWVCSKRSRELPEGGRLQELLNTDYWCDLVLRVQRAKAYAFEAGALGRDVAATDRWGRDARPGEGLYHRLTCERYGLFGAATSRAAPQVLRLSLIYALLDCAREIREEHLLAAVEVWRYCEDSAKFIFGDAMGDPTADTILNALRKTPEGLTRSDINAVFAGNTRAPEIERALNVLSRAGLARFEKSEKGGQGRPSERWFAVGISKAASA